VSVTVPDAFGLTRLFITPNPAVPNPTLAQNLVGGTMTVWDPISQSNTVVVGQVTYQNLPVVSPVGLTEGLVLLQKGPASYIIMGMLAGASSALLAPIRYRRLKPDQTVPAVTFADAGTLNFQVATNTEYGLDGGLSYLSTTSQDMQFAWSGPANMSVKWSMFGLNNATTSSIDSDTILDYGDANPQTLQGNGITPVTCRPWGWFAVTDTPGILQLRVALATAGTAGTLQAGSWLRLSDLGANAGTATYIKQYPIIASRSYDGSGNPIGGTDQDNNVYFSTFPDRSFGQERSMIVFDGATIRSDLAGATVQSARLYLYCIKAEESKGSFQGKSEPNATVPATYIPSSSGFGVNDLWTVNTWNSVECFYTGGASSYLNRIIAGDNAIGLTPVTGGLAATGFHGYGFGAAYRPYIELTYSV
jgi:hypothetical protein